MGSTAHVITAGLDKTMQNRISAWFDTFNFLPPLGLTKGKLDHLDKTGKFQPTLEGLLETMIASSYQAFILIIHGYSDGVGLYLKLASDQASHRPHTTYDDLQRLMQEDERQSVPSADLDVMNVKKRDVTRILQLRRKLLEKQIDCIEFRSCNLGRNRTALDTFRRFFGARLAGAPDIFTLFGLLDTYVGSQMMKDHTKRHTGSGHWVTDNFPLAASAPDLVVCYALNGLSKPEYGGHIVATDNGVLNTWIKKFVKSDGVFAKSPMPMHGLWVGDIEYEDKSRHVHIVPEAVVVQKEQLTSPLGGFGPSDLSGSRFVPALSENYAKHIIYAR